MIMHSTGPFGIEGPSKFRPGCSDGGDYALTIPGNGKSLIVAECFRLLDHGVEVSAIDNARLFAASLDMKKALEGMLVLSDLDRVFDASDDEEFTFECRHCGNRYESDDELTPLHGLCPSDDCPGYIARQALAKAEGN